MSAKSKCGAYTLVGPIKGQLGKLAHSRLFCKSLRCPYCRKPKLKTLRSRIAQLAYQLQLKRFVTLTLDPKRLTDRKRTDRYIRQCWRKMRVSLERKFGKTVQFIGVLEFHKSGVAHLRPCRTALQWIPHAPAHVRSLGQIPVVSFVAGGRSRTAQVGASLAKDHEVGRLYNPDSPKAEQNPM